ncbi:hypothetical protein GCM10009804_74030 [Kribbella hippodromi]|uniref:Uncharacterized protein n=1 Tax=Kribbella hippodromi TaxID=434347 RepID=A0ABN2EHF5_9ACTN
MTGHEHVVQDRLGHVLMEFDDALGVRLGKFLLDEQYDVVHRRHLRFGSASIVPPETAEVIIWIVLDGGVHKYAML